MVIWATQYFYGIDNNSSPSPAYNILDTWTLTDGVTEIFIHRGDGIVKMPPLPNWEQVDMTDVHPRWPGEAVLIWNTEKPEPGELAWKVIQAWCAG